MVTCFRAVSTFLPLRPVSNILRSAAAIFAVQSCTCLAACSGGDYEPLERSPRRRSPVRRIGAPRVVNAPPDRINWKPCCAGRRRRKRGKEEALRIRFRLFHLAVTGLQSGDLCAFAKLWKRPTRARSEKVGAVVAGRDDAVCWDLFFFNLEFSIRRTDAGRCRAKTHCKKANCTQRVSQNDDDDDMRRHVKRAERKRKASHGRNRTSVPRVAKSTSVRWSHIFQHGRSSFAF